MLLQIHKKRKILFFFSSVFPLFHAGDTSFFASSFTTTPPLSMSPNFLDSWYIPVIAMNAFTVRRL